MYIDNTTWSVPATTRARKYLNQMKVRGHLRTRGEGFKLGSRSRAAKNIT